MFISCLTFAKLYLYFHKLFQTLDVFHVCNSLCVGSLKKLFKNKSIALQAISILRYPGAFLIPKKSVLTNMSEKEINIFLNRICVRKNFINNRLGEYYWVQVNMLGLDHSMDPQIFDF